MLIISITKQCISHYADINECSDGTDVCSHLCNNTIGSYSCSCSPCYILGPDGISCYGELSHQNYQSPKIISSSIYIQTLLNALVTVSKCVSVQELAPNVMCVLVPLAIDSLMMITHAMVQIGNTVLEDCFDYSSNRY